MSYAALAGSTPSPIPTSNTEEVRGLAVGVTRIGPGYAEVPWLDAQFVARNVTPAQANTARDAVVRLTLRNNGTVDDVRWTPGGEIYARWRPNSEQPAVSYATRIRDQLLQASTSLLGPRSQIIMQRYRVVMPALRTDLYVYPVGEVPDPPPLSARPPDAPPPDAPPTSLLGNRTIMIVAGAIAVTLLGAGVYLSSRPVRKNRRRRR